MITGYVDENMVKNRDNAIKCSPVNFPWRTPTGGTIKNKSRETIQFHPIIGSGVVNRAAAQD